MNDRESVQDAVIRLFVAVDDKDWATARSLMADTVHFDMSSLGGGDAADWSADDIIAGWTDGLAGVRDVHHQTGNFRIQLSEGSAAVQCYGTAYHYREGEDGDTITTFVGTYDMRLVRSGDDWVVDRLRYDNRFVDTRPAGSTPGV